MARAQTARQRSTRPPTAKGTSATGAGIRLAPETTVPAPALRNPLFLNWSMHTDQFSVSVNDDTHSEERRAVTIDAQFDPADGRWSAGWGPLSITFAAQRNGCDPVVSDKMEASMFRAEDARALALAFTELARQIEAARVRSAYIENRGGGVMPTRTNTEGAGIQLAPDEFEKRGVYLARTLTPNGHHWFYAVSSTRRMVESVEVVGTVTPEAANRILSAKLDDLDPAPTPTRLTVIRGGLTQ